MKKILSFAAALTSCVLLGTSVFASGFCGSKIGQGSSEKDLSWSVSADGVLTVSGSGKLPSYSFEAAPWDGVKYGVNEVILSQGVENIGNSAFSELPNLRSVSVAGTATEIEDFSFMECCALEKAEISEGVKVIGDCAFRCCESLNAIELPESIESIGVNAFSYCDGLNEVKIGSGCKYISDKAFSDCPSLEYVFIYSKDCAFGEDVFLGSPNVTVLGYSGSTAEDYTSDIELPFIPIDQPSTIKGDVNGDYLVNELDLELMFSFLTGDTVLSDAQTERADVYGSDFNVDLRDYLRLMLHVREILRF